MSKFLNSALFGALVVFPSLSYAKDIEASTTEIAGDINLSIASLDTSVSGFSDVSTDRQAMSIDGIFYLKKNVGVGITLDYDHTESSSLGVSSESTTNMIGPVISYNISTGEKTSLKLQGAALYSWAEQVDPSIGTTVLDGFGWRIGSQLSYFINEKVSFNAGINYASINLKDDVFDVTVKTSGIGIGAGISVYLN